MAADLPVFTDAQRQQAYRLESILMPHFRRQRLRIFPDGKRAKRFVHYTSAEAALKIIRSKRMWMRNTTCMADYREVHHGFDFLRTFFSDQINRTLFFQALEPCAAGIAQEVLTLVDRWLPDIQLNTYIASLSEHEDREDQYGRLSMWRAFGGGNITRVALVLNIPKESGGAAAMNVAFSPVAYLTEQDMHAELKSVIENIGTEASFLASIGRQTLQTRLFMMLLVCMICVKHPGFYEEKEWRAVYSPNRASSPLITASTEMVAGVPQLVYLLPLDRAVSPILAELDFAAMFDRLIIGPTPYPWAVSGAFVQALAEAGVANANSRVTASTIPIRG